MKHQILIIDDSLTVRKILEASLSRAGFAVYSFPDGLQAVQALTARQTPVPDAVLLDIGLPKMDGYAVARLLKRQPALHHTVIIMLSGHEHLLDKFRGRLAGACAYVTKPFQPAQVLAVLRSHLAALEPAHQAAKGKAPVSTDTSGAPAPMTVIPGVQLGGKEQHSLLAQPWHLASPMHRQRGHAPHE